jgi:hypothetical protein
MLSVEKIGYYQRRSDMFTTTENENLWANVSLEKHPEENSVVCGYLKDDDANEPLQNIEITIEWGDRWDGYWNTTFSDASGFYSINIAAGEIALQYSHEDYMPKDTDEYDIGENDMIWLNETLTKRPEENAMICGYVTNSVTLEPVNDAFIYFDWRDTDGNSLDYNKISNENGYFCCSVPAGEIYMDISSSGYVEKELGRNDAYANEMRYVNITLNPDIPQVDMSKPLNAIYVNGKRVIPHETCIILGSIDVEPFIHDTWYRSREDQISRVEFFIDDELKHTAEETPFVWTWDEKTFGEHTIKINVVDDEGHESYCERSVQKYL